MEEAGTTTAREDIQKTFDLPEKLGYIVGVRIFDKKKKFNLKTWIKDEWLYYITLVSLMQAVICEIIFIKINKKGSILRLTDVIMCCSFSFLSFLKLIIVHGNKYIIQDIYAECINLWPEKDLRPYVTEMKNRSLKRLRIINWAFTCSNGLFLTLFGIDPIFSQLFYYHGSGKCTRESPFKIWYPFDFRSDYYYGICFMIQVWQGYICVIVNVIQDVIIQVIVSHLALLLEIIQYDLRTLISDDWSYEDVMKNDAEIKIKLAKIVQRHQRLISLCENLESISCIVVGVNMLATSIIVCFLGFLLSVMDISNLIKLVTALMTVMGQVYLLTWFGNILMDKSIEICDAIYNSNWYLYSTAVKRSMLIIMMRSAQPLHITAMKYSKISRQSFTSMISSSWSYFTLLRTMYDGQEF